MIPSFQGFQQRLSAGVSQPMARAGQESGRRFGDAAGKDAAGSFRSSWGQRMRGFAPFAGLAVGAGAFSFLRDAVADASAAEQAVGGVRAVFADYADVVEKRSRDAAQSLGLTSTAYQELVTVSGALLKNKGMSDFAEQADRLVSIGADLAAQYGGDTRQAVEALNAAMRGESDPIERYAISLNETAVNAELAERGMTGLKGAALEQAKTQARLALIMEQAADAQGAFGRESDTLAGQQARLSAQWQEMQAAVGKELLPALSGLATVVNEGALPALSAAGGAAKDAVSAFRDLPEPVQAAAGAFVALRLASVTGLSAAAVSGARSMTSTMESLRIRTMLAGDAFRTARAGSLMFSGNSGRFVAPVGRMSASLEGLRAGAQGAGTALRRGLGSAMGLLGGPWGMAMIGATAAVGHFWAEHEKAKQYVEDLTASLDQQTGAISENTRELLYNSLEKAGATDAARDLGISLDTIRRAAEGQESALALVNRRIEENTRLSDFGADSAGGMGAGVDKLTGAAITLQGALGDTNGQLAEARRNLSDQAEFMGDAAQATEDGAKAFGTYRDRIREARNAILELVDAENERRNANLSARQDQLALAQAIRSARDEAEDGRRTLDLTTEAGLDNRDALYRLAQQWNDSEAEVRNAKGAYADMRRTFEDVAKQMGAGEKQAKRLADELLNLPRRKEVALEVEGGKEAIEELERLRELSAQLKDMQVKVGAGPFEGPGYFSGGYTGNYGTHQVAGVVHGREFVHSADVVDYYGRGFMEALLRKQVPKVKGYRDGGYVAPVAASGGGGVVVNIGTVVAHDYSDFMSQMQRRARAAGSGGVPI